MAMVVGTIIGSGIYLLPATTAPYGWNVAIALVLVAGGMVMLAYCFARLSARLPGGPYSYVAAAFGDTAAFMTMWSYLISLWSGIAAVVVAIGGALGYVAPSLSVGVGLVGVALCALSILAFVNWTGARSAGRLQVVATLLKVIPLLLVMVLVVGRLVGGTPLEPLAPAPAAFGSIVAAGALMLFAFTGFETAAITANVTDKAEEAVPTATFRGTILVAGIYLLATLSVLWLMPSAQVAQSGAPFAEAIAPALGVMAGLLVAVVAAISAFGTGNALLLSSIETMRAIGNAGDLPPAFARTNANGVATIPLVVTIMVGATLVFASQSDNFVEVFTFISLISAVASLVLYLACALSALKLEAAPRAIAAIGILFAIFMLVGSGLEALQWGAGLMVAGLPIRWLSRKRWPNPPAVTPA